MWNPSICDFVCHITCEIDDFLQIKIAHAEIAVFVNSIK